MSSEPINIDPVATGFVFHKILQASFVMFGFVCLIPTCIGAVSLINTRSFVESALGAEGRITGYESTGDGTSAPVFEFTDHDNVTRKVTSRLATDSRPFKKGQKVDVLYDPTDPDTARINTFWQLWAVGPVFALGGLGGILFAGLLFLLARYVMKPKIGASKAA